VTQTSPDCSGLAPAPIQLPRSGSLAGRRVDLFSLTYPPEEVGIAPYAGKTAEHLALVGARVRVITGMPHYPAWRVWDEYRRRWALREVRAGVDVIRLRNYVPAQQSAVRRGAYEASFLLRGLRFTVASRPDAVLAVVPSLSDGVLGRLLSVRHRVPLGVIVQDLTGMAAAQSGVPGGMSVARATARAERWVLSGASGVAVVSDAFVPHLERIGVKPDRIHHVRNWSHLPKPERQAEEVRAELGWAEGQTIILHAGNMGYKQALEGVLEAAEHATSVAPSLRFVVMGDGSQRAALEDQARGLPNVSFIPPQPIQAFADILAAADILLVNERPSVLDMSLPSKLTSYFLSGRPVLASVAPGGATALEVERSGAGVVVPAGEKEALVAAADALSKDGARMEALGRAGSEYANANLREDAALKQLEAFVGGLIDSAR
jgi:colanic acid biosynthesis glycosyl transferase WcaI